MEQQGYIVKLRPTNALFRREIAPLIPLGGLRHHLLRFPGPSCIFSPQFGFFPSFWQAWLSCAATAWADSRIFIIANHADGYGVDQCLAQGESCGAHAARSYCRSRDFAQAVAYRRVRPDEMTD